MKPRVLLALLTVLSICSFQARSSLIVTPKYLLLSTTSQCMAVNLIVGLQDLFPVDGDSDYRVFII